MNKTMKIIIISAAVLAVLLLMVGKSTAITQQELEDNVVKAFVENDAKLFLEQFPDEQSNAEYAEIGAQSIVELDGDSDPVETENDVREMMGYFYEGHYEGGTIEGVSVITEPHFIFFESYKLSTNLSNVVLSEDLENDDVYLNGEKYTHDAEGEMLFPGEYIFESSQDGIDGSVTIIVDGEGYSQEVAIDYGTTLMLPAGPSVIEVYVEGEEETSQSLSSEEAEFGPINDSDVEKVMYNVNLPGVTDGVTPFADISNESVVYFGSKTQVVDGEIVEDEEGQIEFDMEYISNLVLTSLKEDDVIFGTVAPQCFYINPGDVGIILREGELELNVTCWVEFGEDDCDELKLSYIYDESSNTWVYDYHQAPMSLSDFEEVNYIKYDYK